MRLCSVTPCPVVAVLLLIVGGALCEETSEALPTVCYDQGDGVRKPCVRFQKVACGAVGSHPVSLCSHAIDDSTVDERAYHNVSLELRITEGYYSAKDVDECWYFRTSGPRYPKACVPVHLDYFPGRRQTGAVTADEDECAYFDDSSYTMQLYPEDKETLKVRFTFQPVPGVEEVELSLWGGECEITCNGSLNKCELSHQKRIMKNFSAEQEFAGLRQGYYCIRIQHGSCVIHTSTGTVERAEPPPADSPKNNSVLVVAIILSILGVVLVAMLLVFLKRRSHSTLRQLLHTDEQDPPAQWQSIHQQWARSPGACQILLLYSRDCSEFCDVIQAFSQLLKSFGNMKVLDPMEQNQMEKVSENISGWLAQHLRNPDVKVVIVVSEGAKLRQRALLNNQIVRITYPHFLDPVYTQALQQMHEDPSLGSNYTRIFPVRFEDLTQSEESLSLIVPLKCYILQKHLGKLIVELRGFNTPTGPDLEDIRSICPEEVDDLESTIRVMKSYCAVNPHYISKHFSLAVPST